MGGRKKGKKIKKNQAKKWKDLRNKERKAAKGYSNKSDQDTKKGKKSKKNQANKGKDLMNKEHKVDEAKEVSEKRPKDPKIFELDPIQDKLVTTIPGIHPQGAYVLLGQYLVLKKN